MVCNQSNLSTFPRLTDGTAKIGIISESAKQKPPRRAVAPAHSIYRSLRRRPENRCRRTRTVSAISRASFSLRRRLENRCRRTRTVSAISRASSSLRRQLENRCRRTRTVSAIFRASFSLRRQLENRCRRTRTVSAISRASFSLRRRRLPRCSRTSRRAPCRGPTSRNGRDRGSRRSRPPVPGD